MALALAKRMMLSLFGIRRLLGLFCLGGQSLVRKIALQDTMARLAALDVTKTSLHSIRAGIVPPYQLTTAESAALRSEGDRLRKAAEQHLFATLSCTSFLPPPGEALRAPASDLQPASPPHSVAARFAQAARANTSPVARAHAGGHAHTHSVRGDLEQDPASSSTALLRGWSARNHSAASASKPHRRRDAALGTRDTAHAAASSREASPMALTAPPAVHGLRKPLRAAQGSDPARSLGSAWAGGPEGGAQERRDESLLRQESSELTLKGGVHPSAVAHAGAKPGPLDSGASPSLSLEARLQRLQQSLAAVRAN